VIEVTASKVINDAVRRRDEERGDDVPKTILPYGFVC